ncbi:glutathione-regulated potassium-efflux system protein KefC [Comamonas sp.]|uniref:glutathione-regulated potassium-efflux system protein KefC n=1 Tax=Comamonas sp. TaxID=34028 RepID=UPI003A91AF3B
MEHSAPIWLTYGFTYLAAAVLAVPLARALGLGAIIGYLGAGIAMGPWGLGLVRNVEDILHFAEFGVVLMLFVIGLELQPKRLWELRRPIFGWGMAQMAVCTGILFLAAWAFGFSWRVSLIAGMGLALSSTAICLQVMSERNLMRTPSGQAAFSILLFQDVAAIPILALIPILGAYKAAAAHGESHVWLTIFKTVGTIGAVIIGGRLLLQPVLRWIARSKTPEIFTATSLLLVVGIAMLMVQVGLSMALGAFLAGVLLADSEYRSELETNIEPFKGLLLGLFFMAVGMSIDFGVILQSPLVMAAMVLGFLSLKALMIFGLAKVMNIPWRERPVFTLMLAQGGEFAFVVFQTAAQYKVFQHSVSSMLVAAVALSMLLGPLLLVLLDKLLLRRFAAIKDAQDPQDKAREISEPQEAPIIVAGFGRYGQIVARVLLAQGIRPTILDHSVEMLEAAQTYGYRVFYGDATRVDLLRIAGAAQARVLVIAVDAPDQSVKIASQARKHFPDLEIVARARDLDHWFRLRDLDIAHIQREVFESSLASAQSVLELVGESPADAKRMAERFREHNLDLAERMYPHYKDQNQNQLIAVAKQGRQQLVEQMAKERAALLQDEQPDSQNHRPAGRDEA